MKIPMKIKPANRQRGISLVEIMIALALSLTLAFALVQLFITNKITYRTEEGISRIQENARYALDRMATDINSSGFLGCMPSSGNVDNVLSNSSGGYNFAAGIEANNAGNTITIRRSVGAGRIAMTKPMDSLGISDVELDKTDPDYSLLEQYQILAISDCTRAAVFMITNDPSTSNGTIQHKAGVTSPLGKPNPGQSNSRDYLGSPAFGAEQSAVAEAFITTFRTYTVANSTAANNAGKACGTTTPQYCSLWRTDPSGTNELVEGVDSITTLFGIDANNDLVAERFVAASAVTDWNTVIAMRITLGFNSVQQVPDQGVIRKTVSNTFRLRNRGMQ